MLDDGEEWKDNKMHASTESTTVHQIALGYLIVSTDEPSFRIKPVWFRLLARVDPAPLRGQNLCCANVMLAVDGRLTH